MFYYTGTNDVERALKTYEVLLRRKLEPIITSLNKEREKSIIAFKQEAKGELLSALQIIAYTEFQLTFYKYYGNNYDVNSLNKSLSFYIDDKLQPHLTYTLKDFYIDKNFSDDRRLFNQNANIEGSFDRLMDFESLDFAEEVDFYGLSIDEVSPYEWAQDEIKEPTRKNIFRKKRKIFRPQEIYQEAYANTMQKFEIECENTIIPRLRMKFNL